jgi:hypothetical protein
MGTNPENARDPVLVIIITIYRYNYYYLLSLLS